MTDTDQYPRLKIVFDTQTEVIREGSSEPWGDRPCTSSTHDLACVKLAEADDQSAEPVDFPIAVGQTVYVVWAQWSTGDSFGCDEGDRIAVVAVYPYRQIAEAAAAILRAASPRDGTVDDYWNVRIPLISGETMPWCCDWFDWLSSLDHVMVEACVVR